MPFAVTPLRGRGVALSVHQRRNRARRVGDLRIEVGSLFPAVNDRSKAMFRTMCALRGDVDAAFKVGCKQETEAAEAMGSD